MEENHFSREDRDLLVELRTEMTGIRADIKDLKDGTSTTLSDHETRIRRLELWGFTAIGILAALEFYFQYIK